MHDLLASQLLSIHESATGVVSIGLHVDDAEPVKPFQIEIQLLSKTAQNETKNIVERNPVLFNGLFALLAALLGAGLTLLLPKLF